MDTKETLLPVHTPESRPTSKHVQFSRSTTDIDLSSRDESRQTKSARSRSSSKRTKRIASEGQITAASHRIGPSPRQQNTILRLALRSRDSRRSRDDIKYASPLTDYKRLGSSKSFESSISIARRERDLKLRFKLKLWSHTLVYFTRLHQKIIRKNQELEAYKSQMDFTEGNFVSSEDDNVYAGLDVDYFKPVTKIRMSKEAKRILMKDPSRRTDEEIKHVKTDLMATKTEIIQTLPEDCQLRLAKNVGLESLGSKRFIIKEGYAAEYCYLIIVGSVIRASLDEGAIRAVSDDKPLKEGQMFGEDEMKSSSPRKASYISASYTEILRVTAEDYYDIFMAGHNVREDDILLLRKLDIFDGWNLQQIKSDGEKIRRKYFPNNWLVNEKEYDYEDSDEKKPQDSRTFEWIYVVKSGSIQIMKLFNKVKPTINTVTGKYSDQVHTNSYLEFLTKGAHYERFTALHASKFNRPLTASSTNSSRQDLRSAPLLRRLTHLLRPHTSTGSDQRFISTPDSLRNKKIPTSAISSKLVSIPKRRRQSLPHRREQSSPTATPEPHRDDSSLTDDRIDSKEGFDSRQEKPSSSLTDYDHRGSLSRKKHVTIESRAIKEQTTEEGDTIVCKIKTLTKGDVFGLEYIVFDEMDDKNQPGFVLKSNGSECLMIHKKVYRDLIKDDFDLKEKLRSDVSPYPEDDDLTENFLVRTNWEVHKDILLSKVMAEKARLRPQKHGPKYAPIRLK